MTTPLFRKRSHSTEPATISKLPKKHMILERYKKDCEDKSDNDILRLAYESVSPVSAKAAQADIKTTLFEEIAQMHKFKNKDLVSENNNNIIEIDDTASGDSGKPSTVASVTSNEEKFSAKLLEFVEKTVLTGRLPVLENGRQVSPEAPKPRSLAGGSPISSIQAERLTQQHIEIARRNRLITNGAVYSTSMPQTIEIPSPKFSGCLTELRHMPQAPFGMQIPDESSTAYLPQHRGSFPNGPMMRPQNRGVPCLTQAITTPLANINRMLTPLNNTITNLGLTPAPIRFDTQRISHVPESLQQTMTPIQDHHPVLPQQMIRQANMGNVQVAQPDSTSTAGYDSMQDIFAIQQLELIRQWQALEQSQRQHRDAIQQQLNLRNNLALRSAAQARPNGYFQPLDTKPQTNGYPQTLFIPNAQASASERYQTMTGGMLTRRCGGCGAVAEFICSGCKADWYCSRKCQLLYNGFTMRIVNYKKENPSSFNKT